MTYFENLMQKLQPETMKKHLLQDPVAARNHPVIRRLSEGHDRPSPGFYLRFTSCIDPRRVAAQLFSFEPGEAMIDGHPGLLTLPYDKTRPDSFYKTLDFYLEQVNDLKVVQPYAQDNRPVIVLLSHADCRAATRLTGDPDAWGNGAMGESMKAHREFRDAMQAQYAASSHRQLIPYAGYMTIQILRRTVMHVAKYLQDNAGLYPKLALRPPLILPLHDDMEGSFFLVDPLQEYSLTEVFGCLGHSHFQCTHESTPQPARVVKISAVRKA